MNPPISRSTERSDRSCPVAGSAAGRTLSCLSRCTAFLITGMIASLLSPPLEATEFTVGLTNDPDPPLPCAGTFPCSLRDAILAANANPGSDSIVVPQGVYVLSIAGRREDENLQGDLDVTDTLTITGTSAATTVIDAAGIDRVFDVLSGTLTLSGVRVTGGDAADGAGGGLRQIGGGLFLNEIEVVGNRADRGGGIAGDCCGGLVIVGSTIGSNKATGDAGGGVHNSTTLTVADSTIEGNMVLVDEEGGGVATSAFTAAVLFQNTTFSGNAAENGGGFAIGSGNVTFVQCTFSDNSATVAGDAIHNRAQVTFRSTLIDGSCSGLGTVVSHGGNLEGPGNTCSLVPGGATPDLVSVPDRGLRPLAGYGGPTRTHALKGDSPAIGAANQSSCVATDQRRATRDSSCDTGAYEDGAVPPGPNLFADGFESGGAAAWSGAVS